MLLKDILARELKAWPESWGIFCVASKIDGVDVAWFDYRSPVFKGGAWQDVGSVELLLSQEPEDRNEVIVRRFEWQDAVEGLKAEQAAELKWPDGAEFMGTTGEGCPKVFYRNVGGDYEYRYERDTCWSKNMGKPSHVPLIPRPTERAVEWDGASLPPVGAVCEHFGTAEHTNWIDVQVIGHGNVRHHDVAFFEYMAGTKGYTVSYSTANNFRPIRTQEQIAAEEREKAINEMILLDQKGSLSRTHFCGLLYDANYRKQPK